MSEALSQQVWRYSYSVLIGLYAIKFYKIKRLTYKLIVRLCMYIPVLWRHGRNARKSDRCKRGQSHPVISSVI